MFTNHSLQEMTRDNNLNPSNPDDWDDSVILSSFDKGVQSFRSQFTKPAAINEAKKTNNSFADSLASYASKGGRNNKEKQHNICNDSNRKRAKVDSQSTHHDENKISDNHPEQVEDTHGSSARTAAAPTGGAVGTEFQYPAFPPSTGNPIQDQALQGLLMAWYYSGYATGRYQAMHEMGAFQDDSCSSSAPQSAPDISNQH